MSVVKELTPITAIKIFCRICQGLGPKDILDPVRDCKSKWGESYDETDKFQFPNGCPLWPYRLGKSPKRRATMSESQRKAAGDRMRAYHENRRNNNG